MMSIATLTALAGMLLFLQSGFVGLSVLITLTVVIPAATSILTLKECRTEECKIGVCRTGLSGPLISRVVAGPATTCIDLSS